MSDIVGTESKIVQDEIVKNQQKELFYKSFDILNDREKEILCLRYGLLGSEELTQKDVANMLGISQSYISRLEKKIIEKEQHERNREYIMMLV